MYVGLYVILRDIHQTSSGMETISRSRALWRCGKYIHDILYTHLNLQIQMFMYAHTQLEWTHDFINEIITL